MAELESEEQPLSGEELKLRQEEMFKAYQKDPFLKEFQYELGEVLSWQYCPTDDECHECESYLVCTDISNKLAARELVIRAFRLEPNHRNPNIKN